jgi:hypothetical protein
VRPATARRASDSDRVSSHWHGLSRRVRARHRGAWCMGKCMGLFLRFRCEPSPPALDVADDGPTALVDVDVLHRDLLLAFAAVAIERMSKAAYWAFGR